MRDGLRWSRRELLACLVFYASCTEKERMTIPSVVMDQMLSALPSRTRASLKMRFGNFVSLDPQMKNLGHKGLQAGGEQLMLLWNEFSTSENTLDIQKLLHSSFFGYGVLKIENVTGEK